MHVYVHICMCVCRCECVYVYYSVHCKTKIFNQKNILCGKLCLICITCAIPTHSFTHQLGHLILWDNTMSMIYTKKRFKGLGCQRVQCKRRLHVDVYYDCMYTGI